MKLISSKATVIHKRVAPILWFGFISIFIVAAVYTYFIKGEMPPPQMIFVPAVLLIIGHFFYREIFFKLMDEVYDCGEYLLVKNKGVEDRVPLRNIVNVNHTVMINPPRITLILREKSRFGDEIIFAPTVGFFFNPFRTNPVAADLIRRVDISRQSP